ncbi:MAG TPA: hypothetical protein VF556_06440 [Pyrinomonadaceae bacterium]|jgi:hypothetical protein
MKITLKNLSPVLSLLFLLSFSLTVAAQTKQPKTVRDFFLLLPEKYFSVDCCGSGKNYREAKEKYLKQYLAVEDTANGFLSGNGDAAQEAFDMALFRRPDGTYLIGFYTVGEGGVEDTPWSVFLEYKNGKWIDLSKNVIPQYDAAKFIYELPRKGTTIKVYRKDENGVDFYKGAKMYDLLWSSGKFLIKK